MIYEEESQGSLIKYGAIGSTWWILEISNKIYCNAGYAPRDIDNVDESEQFCEIYSIKTYKSSYSNKECYECPDSTSISAFMIST